MGKTALMTIGYEGKTLAEFVAKLKAAKVTRLIDVRELPLSRRKGFSKTPLSEALASAGVEYIHVRAAGNPFRKMAGDDIERCLKLYRQHLRRNPAILDQVMDAVGQRRSALMCMEAESKHCHRTSLAEEIAASYSVRITHI